MNTSVITITFAAMFIREIKFSKISIPTRKAIFYANGHSSLQGNSRSSVSISIKSQWGLYSDIITLIECKKF